VVKTFQYRLYPSRSQETGLTQTLETCRRFYNHCLEERKVAWETEKRSVSKKDQLRQVKALKATSPYAEGIHSHVLQVVVADLDKAFQAFFRRVKAGDKPGYPRFKGRFRFDSFGLKEYGNGFKIDGRCLRISGIGRVRVRWHRPLEGKVKTLRVVRRADGWYASFSCEVESHPLPATGREVGIDVGITHLLATSEGAFEDHPHFYRESQKKLRVLQRRMARRKKGGRNCRKAVLALKRHHQRVQNQRKDYLRKLASGIVKTYDRVALEDLGIQNMVRNRHLSKSILDSGWGYFAQHLSHKAEEAGRVVSLVNPAYTSKTCSECGRRWEGLTLSDRWVRCSCGLSMDRDHNAALNILRAGQVRWGTSTSLELLPQEAAAL
jgi:putative transposase